MKREYLYSILFGLPGLAVAFVLAFFATGFIGGIFWLFIFGDTTWPNWTEGVMFGVFIIVFITVLITSVVSGYKYGKTLNESAGGGLRDIVYAISATLFILLFMLVYLFRSELGPKSLIEQCIYVCKEKGYNGSMIPPNNSGGTTCSCFDEEINEYIEITELTN